MYQLAMLESIGHKDSACKAMGHVLEDLLLVYVQCKLGINTMCSGVVMALGVSWHNGWNEGDVSTVFNVDQVGREALKLLACKVDVISVS